jgi:hypothetical protein
MAGGSRYIYISAASGSTVQIDGTGAQDGDEIEFVNLDGTNSVTIKNPGGGTLTAIVGISGSPYVARIQLLGSTWTLVYLVKN